MLTDISGQHTKNSNRVASAAEELQQSRACAELALNCLYAYCGPGIWDLQQQQDQQDPTRGQHLLPFQLLLGLLDLPKLSHWRGCSFQGGRCGAVSLASVLLTHPVSGCSNIKMMQWLLCRRSAFPSAWMYKKPRSLSSIPWALRETSSSSHRWHV